MLTLTQIREQAAPVLAGLQKKHFAGAEAALAEAVALDDRRKAAQLELDTLNARANALAKEIGGLMKAGQKDQAEAAKAESSALKTQAKDLEETLRTTEQALQQLLYTLPNVPHPSVPPGRTPDDNEVVEQVGTLPELFNGAEPHWDIIKRLDLIDFELGTKITGAGFPVYKGKGARLQRALINFFLDQAQAAGYHEILPPIVVNEASGYGTGQLPDKEGQMYQIPVDGLYLIPTAEVPITNLYRDHLAKREDLPYKNAGYTPCFRREAGSWGAHVRGLNRLHQFDKVEIVQVQLPENSYPALEQMCAHVAGLLQQLELPYRRLRLCGGDMSFASALTYDFEVFSAAQKRWLEVSSVSNFETFQANRLKLRTKTEDGKTQLLHTLNGSALALPRIVAALLENNQQPNGHIHLPKALWPYTGFEKI
ncbi:MAG: serine--tRNA ligase [Bernardetiaceae bacterium]|nr:serine--tRNA ligase [Bernardetiaceae bacterium]